MFRFTSSKLCSCAQLGSLRKFATEATAKAEKGAVNPPNPTADKSFIERHGTSLAFFAVVLLGLQYAKVEQNHAKFKSETEEEISLLKKELSVYRQALKANSDEPGSLLKRITLNVEASAKSNSRKQLTWEAVSAVIEAAVSDVEKEGRIAADPLGVFSEEKDGSKPKVIA
eukprot:Colp12_sorted_trinity150504_noHs@9265